MRSLKLLDIVCLVLVIVGALNWGLIGLFDFNIVTVIFGSMALLVKLIYILIGLSALFLVYVKFLKKE